MRRDPVIGLIRESVARLPVGLQVRLEDLREPGRAEDWTSIAAELLATPDVVPEREALAALRAAWGGHDRHWGIAQVDLLQTVASIAHSTTEPILECGSGLTTVLFAIYAGTRGVPVHSLEQGAVWRARTRAALHRLGLSRAATVHRAPVVDHGTFEWYRVPSGLPRTFGVALCDGPIGVGKPSATRYGLLPALVSRLQGATVLLDDIEREGEQEALARWTTEFGVRSTISRNDTRPFAVVEVPSG